MQTAYGPVLAVALTTAARPSEYLALKWQDINWERGTVSIARRENEWRVAFLRNETSPQPPSHQAAKLLVSEPAHIDKACCCEVSEVVKSIVAHPIVSS